MGSDPRYICNCYDIMAKLAASNNDTRLVINRSLTVSEDKHGNFDVRGIRYYSILGSVNCKNTYSDLKF